MQFINQTEHFRKAGKAEHLMAILSNYTPECLVECRVSCATDQLKTYSGTYSPFEFAQRFKKAVEIAINDPYRAVTHNKGIFNGIDALALATGNDFRAIEAGAHAYACHNGSYSSLTNIHCDDSYFEYTLKVPLAMGTVGGLTKVHPLAKAALSILGNPTAAELMQITAAAGLANNFAAIASLVTTGIQKGHMKLHLANVLLALNANAAEEAYINHIFQNKAISFSMIATKLQEYRTK